jgi:hypothetical protein
MWTNNATVNVFIHYHSPETQSSVCESQEDLQYEDSFTKQLICYDGWTDVGLFVYFDDEFSIEECNECQPPGSDVENVIAYYFEVCKSCCYAWPQYLNVVLNVSVLSCFQVPCDPICITPSPVTTPPEIVTETQSPTSSPTTSPSTGMPTICIPQPELISTTGSPADITETTVQITGPNTDTIDFDVVQTWIQEGNLDEFAIQYLNTDFKQVCEQFTDIAYLQTQSFTAACVENVTSISLYIYVGDEFNIDECNACTAPEGSDDYETYVLELPCVPECIPETSTPAPSAPEVEPTAAPSSSVMPTYCVPQPELVSTTGSPEDITETTIQITGPNTDTIDFDVVQTWIQEGNLDEFAIQYLNTNYVEVCEQFTDVAYEHTESFTAACVENITSISLYIYVGDDFNITECNACTAPIDGSDDYEAYVFELPCVPECVPVESTPAQEVETASPTASGTVVTGASISVEPEAEPEVVPATEPEVVPDTDCFTGIKLLETEKDMWCERNDAVISIELMPVDENGNDGKSVEFTVRNVYSMAANVEILYNMGAGDECQNLLTLDSGVAFEEPLTAICNPVTQTAVIELFVDNNSKSHGANKKKCADQGHNTCNFVYEIPCSEKIMCKEARRLAESPEHHIMRGFVTPEMKAAGESNETEDDAPYCGNKDFPCEGDEESMVYVCHYSNRGGYQTFCIPEADSDMMRFYSNDYCGPCEGWNGVSHAGQF